MSNQQERNQEGLPRELSPERGPDWMDDPRYDGGHNLSLEDLKNLGYAADLPSVKAIR